jgi:hypothetical protein
METTESVAVIEETDGTVDSVEQPKDGKLTQSSKYL